MNSHSQASGAFHVMSDPVDRPVKHFFKELFSSISDDDITGRSAELAYYFFFAIFPGFIFLSSLADIFSGGHDGVRTIVMQHLAAVVPPQAYGVLQQAFAASGQHAGGLTFGIVLTLWSATAGMAGACDTLNAVHDVKESRPWWKVQLTALTLTIITMILILCTIGVLFAGDSIIELIGHGIPGPVWVLVKVGQWAVAIALVAIIFGVTYYLAPDVKDRQWHWITPGTGLGIVLWVAASFGLRLYVHYNDSYSSSYGSIGAVMILLVWFYIAGFALLMGGEVNAVMEDLAARRGDPSAVQKGERAPDQAA
ncbi:MAG TPA: YihY/virulence factor BrkB family protein [Acidobacteriaceae bacterium]|nr:YihY/virulence factor BrkB family protein [Acidobacteriaceae bacterium]